MKKKHLLLLFLTLVLAVGLVSCAGGDAAQKEEVNEEIEGDHIFSPYTKVNIVYNGDALGNDGVAEIYYSLLDIVEVAPAFVSDAVAEGAHEIVIGQTTRAISKEAYRRLGLMERESADYHGYVIYSNGNSVAIAYDEDIFDLHMAEEMALGYFADNYFDNSVLRLSKGVVKSELFNIIERQKEIDAVMVADSWRAVEAKLTETTGAAQAAAIVKSLKSCYTLFNDNVIWWFANLYDSTAGAYYYSNSGRNTVGYGPDLESTYQALAFMSGTGMAYGLNTKTGEDVIPEWMRQQILKFAMELQDPVSGYFYHPQWGGESFDDRRQLIDTGYTSRRGRDLKWALSLIARFGGVPTYDIPTMGVKGSGLLYDGTSVRTSATSDVHLTERLVHSSVSGVSKIIVASSTIPTQLQSVDNMKAYLNKLDVNGDSYYVGNLLESQTSQIVERDKQLDPSGRTTPLATAVKEFFDAHQNKENGAWTLGKEVDYESVNGILKICGVYNGIKQEFPNPIAAIKTAMLGITMEEAPTTVCYVLNPWYAITMLIQNVENYNSSPDKSAVESEIAALRSEILKNAVELIDVTKDKTSKFAKDDGSFSYFPTTSGPNSQGVPVAVPETVEGDVNATYMFISGIPNHIFGILGCEMVPVYTTSDRMRYWTILNELGGIIKDDEVVFEPETYDHEELGDLPLDISVSLGVGSDAKIMSTVGANGKTTQALGFKTVPGNTDIMRLPLKYYEPFYNAVVFEADIKVESLGGSGQIEMLPYGSPGDAYKVIIDYAEDGNVSIRNTNDFASTVIGKEGEWISFKFQYSYADIDYDRNGTKDLYIKIIANGMLVAEGYTPQGTEPVKEGSVSGIRFFSWTAANATLFIDNSLFYQDKVELKPAPIVNPEDNSERITFEESTDVNFPGKVSASGVSESGEVTIPNIGTAESPDKVFKLASKAGASDALKFYITKNLPGFNAIAFETDIMIEAVNDSGEIEFSYNTAFNSTASRLVFAYTKNGDVTVKRVNSQGTAEFTKTVASEGEWFKIRIEYTALKDMAIINLYVGESLVASGNALYNSFHGAENVNMATLTVKDAADVAIYLDDLMFEQLVILQAEGEDSSVGGITFEEDTLESIKDDIEADITDKATVEIVEDNRFGRVTKALKLSSPKDSLDMLKLKISAPTEENKDSVNTVAFEGDFKITDADGGNILTLYHKTADGGVANKIVFGWSASSGNIFVLNMYTVKDGSAKDFDTVVVPEGINAYFRLRIEYTKISDSMVKIGFYVNGNKIADIDTAHPYESSAIDADDITEIVFETYHSRKTTVYVDNLTIERTSIEVESEELTPDTPSPEPENPPTPGDEYDGSIFDDAVDGNTGSGNWT